MLGRGSRQTKTTRTTIGPSSGVLGAPSAPPDRIVRLRHPARWCTAIVLLVLGAMLIHALTTNPRFQWNVVARYFLSREILTGLERTIILTAAAMAIAIILGTVLALMRTTDNPILAAASNAYIWFFRGTPLLVQLIFWYNLAALYPHLSIGIPFGPSFASGRSVALITTDLAAVMGLGLNEAAYMSEIVRSGLLSVPDGQREAAATLGMSSRLTLQRVILPQALRVMIPPTGNQIIGMLKYTSLVSVISLPELLYSAELIYAQNFETIPLLIVASLWYLIVTTVLSIGQSYIERHYSRGVGRRKTGPERVNIEFEGGLR